MLCPYAEKTSEAARMLMGMLRLMRLYYALPLSGGFVVILLYLRGGSFYGIFGKTPLAVASLACLIAGSHVFNDICDVAVDRVNSPWRALPSGRVSRRAAVILAAMLLAGALALAGLCGVPFLIAVAVVAGALALYNAFGKRMGLFKPVFAACLATSLYPLAFVLADPVETIRLKVLFIHPVWLLLSALGYEMLKDVRDAEGDRVHEPDAGYAHNVRFAGWAKAFVVAGAAVAIVPFAMGYCGYIYLAAAMVSMGFAIWAARSAPAVAIRCIYAAVALITAGSLADLLVCGV